MGFAGNGSHSPDGGDGRREAGVEGGGGGAEDPGEEEARVGHRAGEGDAGAAGVRMRAWELFILTETE